MDKPTYDIVIMGASGFTGRLVVRYLHRNSSDVQWAVAGRNTDKLKQVLREETGDAAAVPILQADSQDDAALNELVANARVICTTVGPYALYGSKLVAACARLGTHYCDLTGEVLWMRDMIERYQTLAEQSGARIVFSCGFDSIPSDLGVYFAQAQMVARHGDFADSVKCRVVDSSGGVSGGTVASMMNMMAQSESDSSLKDVLADPYPLNPPNMPRGDDINEQTAAVFDDDFAQWTAPFAMAGINSRVVRRSHALLGYPYGRAFRYDEAMLTGPGVSGRLRAWLVAVGSVIAMTLASFSTPRRMLNRLLPKPGEGPS